MSIERGCGRGGLTEFGFFVMLETKIVWKECCSVKLNRRLLPDKRSCEPTVARKKDNVERKGSSMADKRMRENSNITEANELARKLALQVEEKERPLYEEIWRRYWASVEGGYRNHSVCSTKRKRRPRTHHTR